MCGIAGVFAFSEGGQPFLQRIEQAIQCIRHRGPDGDGVYRGGPVALGHKRLSIIDISSVANQPMYSADRRYVLVFNGEIFNYKELSEKYLPGYSFVSTSDTEVFLALFAKMGVECFVLLRGFFAAAIYDNQTESLYLVRDRFGKKPLHFYASEKALVFGSELKSLLATGVPKELNWDVLHYYFQLNYVPQPLSVLKDTRKVRPGHYLKISGNQWTEHQYHELEVYKEKYNQFSYEDAKARLVELMDEATRLRLISDVPLGAFLSGGIDSSVVVAMASRHQQKLQTFSIGYKDNPFFDETHYANLVAKKFRTEHTVFSLTSNDFLEEIDSVLDFIDEPFADSSAIPSFILSKKTRMHVTVALSGDGGDEVFAGYNKYKAEWKMMQPSFQKSLVKGLGPLWNVLPKSRNGRLTNKVRQLHRFAEGAGLSAEERYWRWASILSREESARLFNDQLFSQAKSKAIGVLSRSISGHDLNEVLLADMDLVLAGDMLVKVDMMSMANSLEIRSPFLDQEVVEFAFGLPVAFKIDGQLKKKIVQDAFKEILPIELYNRPKQGFEIPLLDFFRKELWGKINDDLLSKRFLEEQGIFNTAQIEQLKLQLLSRNPGDAHATIWALLVFQHWWKRYIA